MTQTNQILLTNEITAFVLHDAVFAREVLEDSHPLIFNFTHFDLIFAALLLFMRSELVNILIVLSVLYSSFKSEKESRPRFKLICIN